MYRTPAELDAHMRLSRTNVDVQLNDRSTHPNDPYRIYECFKRKTRRFSDDPRIPLSHVRSNSANTTIDNGQREHLDLYRWFFHTRTSNYVDMESFMVPPDDDEVFARSMVLTTVNVYLQDQAVPNKKNAGRDPVRCKDQLGFGVYFLVMLNCGPYDKFDHPETMVCQDPMLIGEREIGKSNPELISPQLPGINEVYKAAAGVGRYAVPGQNYYYGTRRTYCDVRAWPGDDITLRTSDEDMIKRRRLATSRTAARTLRRIHARILRLHTPPVEDQSTMIKNPNLIPWAEVHEEVWVKVGGSGRSRIQKRYKVTNRFDDTYIWWHSRSGVDLDEVYSKTNGHKLAADAHRLAEMQRKNKKRGKQGNDALRFRIVARNVYKMSILGELTRGGNEYRDEELKQRLLKFPVGSIWIYDTTSQIIRQIVEGNDDPIRNPPSTIQLIHDAYPSKSFKQPVYIGNRLLRLSDIQPTRWALHTTHPSFHGKTYRSDFSTYRRRGDSDALAIPSTTSSNVPIQPKYMLVKKYGNSAQYEIANHCMVSDREWSPLIRFMGAAVRENDPSAEERYRVFLEYARGFPGNGANLHGQRLEGKDLQTLVMHHSRHSTHIPEKFIWVVFLNLVDVCINLEHEDVVSMELRLNQILISRNHRKQTILDQFRPVFANVDTVALLDAELTEEYIPTSQLGWLTPEQWRAATRHPEEQVAGQAVHVFNIALIIWAMMRNMFNGLDQQLPVPHPIDPTSRPAALARFVINRVHSTEQIDAQKLRDEDLVEMVVDVGAENTDYSAELESLVSVCMAYDPALRRGLHDVRDDILTHMRSWVMAGGAAP